MSTIDVATGGLRGILDGLMKIEGVTAALVVGRDGFIIEAASEDGADLEAVGAIAAGSLSSAEAMGGELHMGPPTSLLIEYEGGPVAVSPAGADGVLAVVGKQHANLGRLRIEMRRIRTAVANQL